ncbi:MAG: glycosyltransferase family 2 protein [Myxococcales bacterium]
MALANDGLGCTPRLIPLANRIVWSGQSVSVIVPCYRESRLIGRTLARIPYWVDRIHAVDDGSDDGTSDAILAIGDPRIELVRHATNQGVGAAIASGYRRAIELGSDLLVVMAGDNQMDPEDLPQLLGPLVQGDAEYTKGNRFLHRDRRRMPRARRLGGALLSFATRCATGLAVSDSQCGYTALRASAARRLPLTTIWPRFGYPNDLLGMMAARGIAVRDVVVRPIYADEQSGIRPWHFMVVLFVILRRLLLDRAASGRRVASRSRLKDPDTSKPLTATAESMHAE